MALTLLALLATALLLPGVVAVWAFYRSAQTKEIDPIIPSMGTTEGIAALGTASICVHLLYIVFLTFAEPYLPAGPMPVADPYLLLATSGGAARADVLALFLGLAWLCAIAAALGAIVGRQWLKRGDRSLFYGPLAQVVNESLGDDRFITAYVVTKIAAGDGLLGYEGTVISLSRDEDRHPAKVILKNVTVFVLDKGRKSIVRGEGTGIDWIALTSTEWHNVAFRVFRVEEALD